MIAAVGTMVYLIVLMIMALVGLRLPRRWRLGTTVGTYLIAAAVAPVALVVALAVRLTQPTYREGES